LVVTAVLASSSSSSSSSGSSSSSSNDRRIDDSSSSSSSSSESDNWQTTHTQKPSPTKDRIVCTEDFGNLCKFHPGDVWTGKYAKTNVDLSLSESEFAFSFAPENYVMETNRLGTNWNRIVITDNYLAVQEFAAFPDRVDRDCNVTDVAKYQLLFSKDCQTAEITGIIEPCRRRQALYNGMQFTLQSPTGVDPDIKTCDFKEGSGIWQAKYRERINDHTGMSQVGTFTFGPNGAVVETSQDAVYFYRFHALTSNSFKVADYGSQDLEQRCTILTKPTPQQRKPIPIESPYDVIFADKCMEATLLTTDDACMARKKRLDQLQLFRVPLPEKSNTTMPVLSCKDGCEARLIKKADIDLCVATCMKMR